MDNDYPQQPMDGPEYYGQTHQPQFGQQKKSKKKLYTTLGIIAGVLVLAGAAVAAYFMFKPDNSANQQAATQQTTTEDTQKSDVPAGTQKVGDKYQFKSTKLNIGVTYPQSWTLRESSDKEELILTSPSSPYVKKDGTSTEGVFTVKLRYGIIPQAIKNTVANSVAVIDSEVIAYAKPATDQREYTNLSYLGPDADHFSFALVTGYTEYKAGQSVGGGVDLNGQAYMFAGGFGADANDSLTYEQIPKADFNTAVFKQAVAIFESLQLY